MTLRTYLNLSVTERTRSLQVILRLTAEKSRFFQPAHIESCEPRTHYFTRSWIFEVGGRLESLSWETASCRLDRLRDLWAYLQNRYCELISPENAQRVELTPAMPQWRRSRPRR